MTPWMVLSGALFALAWLGTFWIFLADHYGGHSGCSVASTALALVCLGAYSVAAVGPVFLALRLLSREVLMVGTLLAGASVPFLFIVIFMLSELFPD